jgi:pilus assembly protein CpaF
VSNHVGRRTIGDTFGSEASASDLTADSTATQTNAAAVTAEETTIVAAICESVCNASGEIAVLIDEAVRQIAPLATAAQRQTLRDAALAQMSGLGELDQLVSDPTIDEVLVNGNQIWIDRNGSLSAARPLIATTVEHVIERILAPIGRRVDRTTPIVDARLASGARVCAVVAPVAIGGSALSIRRFATDVRALRDFTNSAGAELIGEVVDRRCNAIVCGATSSGKTSLLAAILERVNGVERLIVLEDTAEIPCTAQHVVRFEARPASVDGVTAISLSELVRTALRLRPDRLIVGEVRGDEVLGLVQAMNTGHDGSFSTCHANGPLDALLRLESLVLQAAPQWPLVAVRQQLARSIDVIIHVGRSGSRRQVLSIDEVVAPDLGGEALPPGVRCLGRLDESDQFRTIASLTRSRR